MSQKRRSSSFVSHRVELKGLSPAQENEYWRKRHGQEADKLKLSQYRQQHLFNVARNSLSGPLPSLSTAPGSGSRGSSNSNSSDSRSTVSSSISSPMLTPRRPTFRKRTTSLPSLACLKPNASPWDPRSFRHLVSLK
eukprot:m.12739 g.12739  ORF g.12739 m.12739 type:complete len:137 (+) comp10018_c0_seq1:252-662(+)